MFIRGSEVVRLWSLTIPNGDTKYDFPSPTAWKGGPKKVMSPVGERGYNSNLLFSSRAEPEKFRLKPPRLSGQD